jgi:phosphohistidine swiveling domain-containing protein
LNDQPSSDLLGHTYPGAGGLSPSQAVPALSAGDLDLAWGLDFHYPRGILPLTHELVASLLSASRSSAEGLPAVTGRGLVARVIGPHVYTAGLPVLDPAARAERAAAAAAEVTTYPRQFQQLWRDQRAELDEGYGDLLRVELNGSAHELAVALDQALAHFRRAWQIHFEAMYRLLAVTEVFRTVCRAVGLADAASADILSSGDTAIQRADRELRRLAHEADQAGLRPLLDRDGGLLEVVAADGPAAAWWVDVQAFVDLHGERSDTIVDVGAPAWSEQPEQVLGLVRDLLRAGSPPTDEQLHRLEAEREARTRALVAEMGPRDRAVFSRSLASVRSANFAWWNEDHNACIDLRAHLPVRRIARAIAVRQGGDPDDGLFLFADELRTFAEQDSQRTAIADRRAYYAEWLGHRKALPSAVGRPSEINDPVLAEIVGVPTLRAPETNASLFQGLGVSPGVARGTARVVTDPSGLHRLQKGDILVCEATSPSWTIVFPRLAACVCDSGGALTHAAIICREYALPCVSAVGFATRLIPDGALIEVDGRAGTVTLLQSP